MFTSYFEHKWQTREWCPAVFARWFVMMRCKRAVAVVTHACAYDDTRTHPARIGAADSAELLAELAADDEENADGDE